MAWAFSALAQSQLNNETESSTVMRTARIIQALPELNHLIRNQSDASKITPLRQVIIERVLLRLEMDATIAQIDNEIAQSNEVRGYLSDRQDKAVNRTILLSNVSGGTLRATSAGLQLPSGEDSSSSLVGIAASVLSSRVAISGIRCRRAQPGYSTSAPIRWPRVRLIDTRRYRYTDVFRTKREAMEAVWARLCSLCKSQRALARAARFDPPLTLSHLAN